jgi:hypothetical protein
MNWDLQPIDRSLVMRKHARSHRDSGFGADFPDLGTMLYNSGDQQTALQKAVDSMQGCANVNHQQHGDPNGKCS